MGTWYRCRICWNSEGWTRPTGEAARYESKGTYAVSNGFGHEEWLLDFTKLVDGWHYAFLQPVNKSCKGRGGEKLNLVLYTRSPEKQQLYVGRLRDCEVLTSEKAEIALAEYLRSGWLDEMVSQVNSAGGTGSLIRQPRPPVVYLFNVRFRPWQFEPFDPPREAEPNDPIRRPPNRYQLERMEESVLPKRRRLGSRAGTRQHKRTGKAQRKGHPDTVYDLAHNRLQNRLLDLLADKYGKNVVMEEDWVDVRVDCRDLLAYIEVKSKPFPRLAIREALGQLLHYAWFYPPKTGRTPRLVVAAPAKVTPEAEEFLRWLKDRFRIGIEYIEVYADTQRAPL